MLIDVLRRTTNYIIACVEMLNISFMHHAVRTIVHKLVAYLKLLETADATMNQHDVLQPSGPL